MERDHYRHCFKPGECRTPTGEPLDNCPRAGLEATRYIQKSSAILPERLCLDALQQTPQTRTRDHFKDLVHDIEYDLERALVLPSPHAGEFQQLLLQQVTRNILDAQQEQDITSSSRLPYYFKLKHLQLFMPFFRERILGRPIGDELRTLVEKNIATWLEDFDDTYVHSGNHKNKHDKNHRHDVKFATSARAELETAYLFLRAGFVVFPTTKRQEASQARPQHNHDFYAVPVDNGSLVLDAAGPVQVKESSSDSGYADVITIQHYDILRSMRREPTETVHRWQPQRDHPEFEWPNPYVYRQIMNGHHADPLTRLIIFEQLDRQRFDTPQRNALNLASGYVSARYFEYIRRKL